MPLFRGTEVQGMVFQRVVDSQRCLSNLSALGTAALNFAADHQDALPLRWQDLTNGYLASPAPLYCPADLLHPRPTNWADVDFATVHYGLAAAGDLTAIPPTPLARCLIHGNWLETDSSRHEAQPYEGGSFPVAPAGALYVPRPALEAAREQALAIRCLNNLKQIGLAAQRFATDHADLLPGSLEEFAPDYLASVQVLFCPADSLAQVPPSFSDLEWSASSYRWEWPGGHAPDPALALASCRIHGSFVQTDGAARLGTDRYPPRLILGHPLSQTVAPGHTMTLAVLTGDPALGPFRYQWRRHHPFDARGNPSTNTISLPGATNRTYILPAAQTTDEGYYDVVVRDSGGGYQVSSLAYVRVESLEGLRAQPEWPLAACLGNLSTLGLTAHLYATENGGRYPDHLDSLRVFLGWPLSLYCPADAARQAPDDWAGVDFDNTSYELTPGLPDPAEGNNATNLLARCKVHGLWVQADGVRKAGARPPVVLRPLAPQSAFAGQELSLPAGLFGDELAYQWFKDGEPVGGATNSVCTMGSVQSRNAGDYAVVASNPWGSVTNSGARLTVVAVPGPALGIGAPSIDGALTVSVTGLVGGRCVLEVSNDAAVWDALATNTLAWSPWQWTNLTSRSHLLQLYRATLR